jgi:hypothetical protein
MAALEAFGSEEIGNAVGEHIEIHATVVVVEEESVVEGC